MVSGGFSSSRASSKLPSQQDPHSEHNCSGLQDQGHGEGVGAMHTHRFPGWDCMGITWRIAPSAAQGPRKLLTDSGKAMKQGNKRHPCRGA